MSGKRVDIDDLRTLAVAAQESARERGDNYNGDPFGERWILGPRRDGAVDVVVASSGADVFDRALLVDAAFAVAAQPAVVLALLDRISALETCLRDAANVATPAVGEGYRAVLERGVVMP